MNNLNEVINVLINEHPDLFFEKIMCAEMTLEKWLGSLNKNEKVFIIDWNGKEIVHGYVKTILRSGIIKEFARDKVILPYISNNVWYLQLFQDL